VSKPTIKTGQEWEKAGNDRGRLAVRLRVVTDPDGAANPSVQVESKIEHSQFYEVVKWGRRRRLMCSALSNTPKGYRLMKEAP
jgi:hypothetical protein